MPVSNKLLRQIPSVEAMLQEPAIRALLESAPRTVVVDAVRDATAATRERVLAGTADAATPEALREAVVSDAVARARAAARPHYRKVINATGLVLHTALGRAVLPEKALRRMADELTGYSLLQADVESGARSDRDGAIEKLLTKLTGAEAATVVNNNAAATAIVLNTIGRGREIIVSRGQLVEIGGSFRLPEVMESAGVRLVEVGATNKTHARDYERAITENTAALMRVHPSNYKIVGFASEVPLEELVAIAHAHNLPLIDDVGAGALVDLSKHGFAYEPTLADSLRGGADVVTSSGDKLIGGPQAGIIIGKGSIVSAIRKNPMARMMRVDKLTLIALEATLSLFLDAETALSEVPTLRMILRPLDDIAAQAQWIAAAINSRMRAGTARDIEGFSQAGSGSLPGQDIPTRLVAVTPEGFDASELARRLRAGEPPVFTRVQNDAVLIDPRTVLAGEEETLVEAVVAALARPGASK